MSQLRFSLSVQVPAASGVVLSASVAWEGDDAGQGTIEDGGELLALLLHEAASRAAALATWQESEEGAA